jgi:hypothetical protein
MVCLTVFGLMLAATMTIWAFQQPSGPITDRHIPVSEPFQVAMDFPFNVAESPDTYIVAEFLFDGPSGADPQGWISVDRTADTVDTFWHVDSFMVPAEGGSKAMWCGANVDSTGKLCSYGCLPGYGNQWDQLFEMKQMLSTRGDVTISFDANWDTELGYDIVKVFYQSGTNEWTYFYEMEGNAVDEHVIHRILEGDLSGQIRFRFQFLSDEIWSDEDCLYDSDGAIQLDNITISDSTGIIHFEDFEDEQIGATTTEDSVWMGRAATQGVFGDYAGLFDGATLVQEDTLHYNDTYLWAFINGSTTTCYAWWSHPDEITIPYDFGGDWPDMRNEIWSPLVDWTKDVNGEPIPAEAAIGRLQFDVYLDLDPNDEFAYAWNVRSTSSSSPCRYPAWQVNARNWGRLEDWFRFDVELGQYLVPNADSVQVALGVVECCHTAYEQWCPHQSPMFDNVRLIRIDTTSTGTGFGDKIQYTNELFQNYPNPFNPNTTIKYSIKDRANVSLKIYNVAGQLVRTLLNEEKMPGIYTIQWNGEGNAGDPVASGVYFYRMATKDFIQTHKLIVLK